LIIVFRVVQIEERLEGEDGAMYLVLIHSGTALYSKYPLFMLQLFLATFMEFTLFVEVTSVTYSFYYKIIAYQAYT
jgi:hypothetical protein